MRIRVNMSWPEISRCRLQLQRQMISLNEILQGVALQCHWFVALCVSLCDKMSHFVSAPRLHGFTASADVRASQFWESHVRGKPRRNQRFSAASPAVSWPRFGNSAHWHALCDSAFRSDAVMTDRCPPGSSVSSSSLGRNKKFRRE